MTVLGLAGLAFGAWGIFTPGGRANFDEMDGLYPYFAGLAGAGLIVIALGLQLIAIFVPEKKPGDPPAKPKFTRYSIIILLAIPLCLYILFEVFCDSALGADGFDVLSYWWENASSRWFMLIGILVLVFIYSVLLVDYLGVLYAVYFGLEDVYVYLGKDLSNGPFYYDFSDQLRRPLATVGGIYDQTKWFYDGFFDLKKQTVIQYGHRPRDVLDAKAFGVSSAVLAVFVQWVLLFMLILLVFTIFGNYLEKALPDAEAFQAETNFVLTISWLWAVHHLAFVMVLAGFAALTVAAIWLARKNQKMLQQKFRSEVINPLPDSIAPGQKVSGEIVDYSIESRKSGATGTHRTSHYNLLVKFEIIYLAPIWLRLSLSHNATNKDWFQRVKGSENIRQNFTIQEDMSIWPDDLEIEDRH